MVDGTTSLAQGIGISYIAGLILKSVLYVPNLSCNLLSISKITKERNCLVIFFHSHCVFQDLSSEKMIGKIEKGVLYQLSRLHHPIEFRLPIQSSLAIVSKSELMLWHQQ